MLGQGFRKGYKLAKGREFKLHRMSHREQRGRVGTSAVTRFISLDTFSAWLALQRSVGIGVPLVPETLPLWAKGSGGGVCVF